MEENKKIVHHESRLIAGVFREALLTGREVLLSNGHERIWTPIKDIQETSSRDRTTQRVLILKINTSSDADPEILIPFGRYVFRSTLIRTGAVSENAYLFPETLVQETQRKFERFRVAESNWSKITLVQEDITVIGDFCIEEIGYDSIRGLLTLPGEIQLRKESLLVGNINSGKGLVKVNGAIVRATEVVAGEEQVFRVVLKQQTASSSNDKTFTDGLDRRSEKRFRTLIELVIESPFLEKKIRLKVHEVTSTTLRGTISDSMQTSNAVFGVEYKIENREVILHLIANRGDEFIFEILSSDEPSSKWWFDVYSAAVQPTLYSDAISTQDILRLFCEAGAFSTTYIKGSKLNSRNIEDGFLNSQSATWLHRWIEVKNGQFTGYVSAINLMKDVWFIGDLVGGQTEKNKISPEFMSSFFYAFTRYLKAFKPDHKILMTWIKDHPYWATLQKRIESDTSNVFSSLGCYYTRITGEEWSQRVSLSKDFLLTTFDPSGIAASGINFGRDEKKLIDSFIAASLSAASKRINKDLGGNVASFKVSFHKETLFGFFIDIQEGASINKFPQSVFLFDPNSVLKSENWLAARDSIVAFCGKLSLYPSSIRRIIKDDHSGKFEGETAAMSLYLVAPEFFDANN